MTYYNAGCTLKKFPSATIREPDPYHFTAYFINFTSSSAKLCLEVTVDKQGFMLSCFRVQVSNTHRSAV